MPATCTAMFVLAFSLAAGPGVIVYEGDVLPENLAWERVGTFDADRTLVGGKLIIDVDLGVWEPVPGGEQDFYMRWVSDFAGQPFFVEWRCMSDAPNSEIPGVGGSVLNAAGFSVTNHFNATADQLCIWRGNSVPLLYVDIAPATPHIYRVEHYGDKLYAHYVDGVLVDSGKPLGDFPNSSARIIWGSRMWMTPSTNEWDYVRYGTIPQDASGDYDSDGDVDADDYYYVSECLTKDGPGIFGGPENDAGPGCRFADFDADGDVDLRDIALFQRAFAGTQ